MLQRILCFAGAMTVALAAAQDQEEGFARSGVSSASHSRDALVLVLNVISATHARPVTGVVLARDGITRPALVLVPAEFVSAGDDIVVLDGGTDILRHGRPGRTVARSTETGVAVLEVEGLVREGVALSADEWRPGDTALEFAAWPPAGELADGAPVIERSVQMRADTDGSTVTFKPALPDVSGPLFDRCGHLAAVHLPGGKGLLDVEALRDFLRSFDLEPVQLPCSKAELDTQATPGPEEVTAAPLADETPAAEGQSPRAPGQPAQTSAQPSSPPAWAWFALSLAVLAAILYIRGRARRSGCRILLQASGPKGQASTEVVRFRPGHRQALLERSGHAIAFELRDGRMLVSDRGQDDAWRLALAINGTACLPGEVFFVGQGDELHIGADRFTLSLQGALPRNGEPTDE
ncbi:MAG: hypothetical protein R3212_06330 [Xanthomonadales bacterium]|nr:hypothetical protein [Xanthomonadales bacterium]